jgi:uncharacterized damage-inducible protein DinB
MTDDILVKLFEHNNWANMQILQACSALSDEQLDAEPISATHGSIRSTLLHLVNSQRGYLALLTRPVEERRQGAPAITDLQESARLSGEGLLELIRNAADRFPRTRLETTDGYRVEPWIVMIQIINHATEHREQIKSMLTALGVTAPEIDGWDYGFATNTLVPISK